MEELIKVFFFIAFAVVALLTRVLGRRKPRQEPDIIQEDKGTALPPWGNLLMEEEIPVPQSIESEMPSLQTRPAPPTVQGSPETTAETVSKRDPASAGRTDSSPSEEPAIAGIPLSPQTFRQGVILAEILGRPKFLRRPQQ